MAETTNVYIDVDGVLNALPTPSTYARWGWSEDPALRRRKRINGFMITWSTEMVDALNEILALDGVTPVWLTTWCDDAPALIAPELGLVGGADWEVLRPLDEEDMFMDTRHGWWKLRAIQEHLDVSDPGRAVWLDDDLAHERPARDWLEWQASQPGLLQVLGISPRLELGLRRSELEEVRAWILS